MQLAMTIPGLKLKKYFKGVDSHLRPYLGKLMNNGIFVGGQQDYLRFIILGRSRTGSNYLRSLLNSHSQVVTFGELFRNYEAIDFAYPGYELTQDFLSLAQNDPRRFIETVVYQKFPRHIAAVGFKIFYYHAQNDSWKPIWSYLRDQKNMRVIHIKRRNILRTHLSRNKAEATDLWVNLTGTSEELAPIRLDYEQCLVDFQQTRAWELDYDSLFREHEMLEIYYEDLDLDANNQIHRLLDFLQLPSEPLMPETHKQNQQSLSTAIANYWELKEKFSGTPWSIFFED